MTEIPIFDFSLVLALVPICQGLVQMLKQDSFPTYVTRLLSLVIGVGLVFIVRQAGIEASVALVNPYMAGLSGLVVALVAGGAYNMIKSDIVEDVATSKSDVAVPSKLVGVEPGEVVPGEEEDINIHDETQYGKQKV